MLAADPLAALSMARLRLGTSGLPGIRRHSLFPGYKELMLVANLEA
jgi:hypothetical protein